MWEMARVIPTQKVYVHYVSYYYEDLDDETGFMGCTIALEEPIHSAKQIAVMKAYICKEFNHLGVTIVWFTLLGEETIDVPDEEAVFGVN